MRIKGMLVAVPLLALLAACGGSSGSAAPKAGALSPSPVWTAPPDPLQLATAAGLTPEKRETLVHHVHSHLDVFLDGRPVIVPAGIGINTKDPGVKTFSDPVGYGGIEGCAQPCISPLHTHGEDGVLHTESADARLNTLGQFFVEWGVRLTPTCLGDTCSRTTPVKVYVDGKEYSGDPTQIQLSDHKEIAIVIGKAPASIPKSYDFSHA